MATDVKPTAELEPAIESLLVRLRRRIRAYLWADGIAALLLLLLAAFWVSLALDWVFEPPRPLRAVLLAGVAGGAIWILYRQLISRLLVPLPNRSLALVLERRFRHLDDSLLTAVELTEDAKHAAEFNPQMLSRSRREALARSESLDLGLVFRPGPLVQRLSLVAALGAALAVFAVAAPDALATWARRSLLLSNELWPRYTSLSVEGFGEGGRVKIARGGDWNLVVKADAALGREIPEIVEVRFSTIEGAHGRENMSREGVVRPGEAEFQPYAYSFQSVLAPLEFYVTGGDDREGPFYLDVVDSPTISGMTLRCQFPAYTGRAARDLPVAGLMQIPAGTEVTILAKANKPLVSVQIDDVADENAPVTHRIDVAAEAGQPQDKFEFSLGRLDADKTLLFTLQDHDDIRSREAIRLTLAAVPDEPPELNVSLKGIGTAITPQARLPAAGEVSDDYGVDKVWFDYHVDEAAPQQTPLEIETRGAEKLEVAGAMDVASLGLKPKQRLHWAVQAADRCALAMGPNVGTSQRYALDIVTPEELRSMLEARELMLRRRFETIIAELTDTRDLLAGLSFAAKDAKEQEPAEGADEPGAGSRRSETVQAERVLQNSERAGHETLQLAESFDEIRAELINNRIDTEELKTRLQQGIADPLRAIAQNRFPPLVERLKQLVTQVSDPAAADKTQSESVKQIDAILVEMQGVLDKMLELETFNEVLDMLRQIIDNQEQVNEETKQKQKKDLRSLIE